jgi:phosphoribosylformimino-5-aminoimidazole carboxamide ribotide isomerase
VIVIPAIDIRGGRVVRLVGGHPEREIDYGEDPTEAAARFAAEGATLLHVVDLDAALGIGENRDAVRRVISGADVPVQAGGGIRSSEALEAALALGAARVVLGTAAVEDPAFLADALQRAGDRVVVALDTDGDSVLVRGWSERGGPIEEILAALERAGAPRFLVTAVARDGRLGGPDVALYERMVSLTPRPVMASGGVGTLDHVEALAATGVEAVIVGRALYEGSLRLPDALRVVEARR